MLQFSMYASASIGVKTVEVTLRLPKAVLGSAVPDFPTV